MRLLLLPLALISLLAAGCGDGNASNNATPPPAHASGGPANPRPATVDTPTVASPPPANVLVPKADMIAELAYTSEAGNKVELAGVCKLGEDTVACWGPKGEPNKDLEKLMLESLKVPGIAGSNQPTMGLKFGMKNRVVVLKVTSPATPSGGTAISALNVTGFGSNPMRQSNPIQMKMPSQAENGPFIRYVAQPVVEEPSAKTTTARLVQRDTLKESKELPMKVGETANLSGQLIKLSRIISGVRDPLLAGESDRTRPSWMIEFDQTGSAGLQISIHLELCDESGVPIQYVDPQGSPVTKAKFDELMQSGNADGISATVTGATRSEPRRVRAVIYVNPEVISKIILHGVRQTTIELAGIPLDPKK